MNILEKIEEIRKKPENIRIRYVWGSVFVSMIIIIFIWLLFVSTLFKTQPQTENEDGELDNLKEQLRNIQKPNNVPSIKDFEKETGNNVKQPENTEFKYPDTSQTNTTTNNEPRSGSYSNIQNDSDQ